LAKEKIKHEKEERDEEIDYHLGSITLGVVSVLFAWWMGRQIKFAVYRQKFLRFRQSMVQRNDGVTVCIGNA